MNKTSRKKMDWYLIHTKPRQEFRAQENLRNQGYETFLPTIKLEKIIKKNILVQEEPLFARYLFICLDQVSSNWFPIKSTRGVHQIVRFGNLANPLKVPASLIEYLSSWRHDKKSPKSLFEVGEMVQIQTGPFRGLQGDFQKLLHEPSGESRALIFIEILGKIQQIKLPIHQISLMN